MALRVSVYLLQLAVLSLFGLYASTARASGVAAPFSTKSLRLPGVDPHEQVLGVCGMSIDYAANVTGDLPSATYFMVLMQSRWLLYRNSFGNCTDLELAASSTTLGCPSDPVAYRNPMSHFTYASCRCGFEGPLSGKFYTCKIVASSATGIEHHYEWNRTEHTPSTPQCVGFLTHYYRSSSALLSVLFVGRIGRRIYENLFPSALASYAYASSVYVDIGVFHNVGAAHSISIETQQKRWVGCLVTLDGF